ncbi:MAG: hypothetical protein AMJ42_04715 [Deltaproteobacteria bacterium DG_8]|nr:MAG: hypothetical protein AMJ42_04715 [Deltaproteobacteria bacterium DG_8]
MSKEERIRKEEIEERGSFAILDYSSSLKVSELIQFIDVRELLVTFDLCHTHGMMEYWNIG